MNRKPKYLDKERRKARATSFAVRRFRRIDDPDILENLLLRRRAAMFTTFKQMELYDRVELAYLQNGEEIPDDISTASINIPRSKWSVQAEFLKRFDESERFLDIPPTDAKD
jgi:hypothetical protein